MSNVTEPKPATGTPKPERKPLAGLETLATEKRKETATFSEVTPRNHPGATTPDEDLPQFDGAIQTTLWDDIKDSIPQWVIEFLAIGAIVIGLLSFLALFNPSGGVASAAMADLLTTLFGYGGFLVAAAIFLLGVVILLPRIGIVFRFSLARILALEVLFLGTLGLLHIIGDATELRTLVRNGIGGGIIGWGISVIPFWLLGRSLSIVLFGIVLLVAGAVVAGVSRRQVVETLIQTGNRLLSLGAIHDHNSSAELSKNGRNHPESSIELMNRGAPIMRIVQNKDNLPPSLRMSINTEEEKPRVDVSDHPLFHASEKELKLDFNIIGELTKQRTEDGHLIVKRPDGREKRYFSVEEMREEKKVAKREKYLPDLTILHEEEMQLPDEDEINRNVVLIENTLLEFDIDIDVVNVQVGPTVTRYAVQPYRQKSDGSTERTRLGKIASYHSDLSLSLSAKRLRLEIPVPGTNFMGIEVPNRSPSVVTLRSVFESKYFHDKSQKSGAPLFIPLGRDVSGSPVAVDLAKMPHLLIAGTTGSGKSVCIGAMAAALLLNNHPDTVKMVMLDPKMVELSRFNGLPHLLGPVETDVERIIGVLKWCTREMDRRYKLLEEHAVRNIDNYNAKFGNRRRGKDYMPHIVILIDEIGDLMMSQPEETERAITRLAQMARAVGMHLVIATQRPSVDVITGLIKANFPGRIAFSVASGVDSRVILDSVGAEHLMGKGDMLYLAPDSGAPMRVQGCYVTDEEVRQIVAHWTTWFEEQIAAGTMSSNYIGPWQRGLTRREFLAETDPMLEEVIEFVVETQEASASLIQRHLGLGYPRAARIVDMLEELGVVGEPVGGGRARKVLIQKGEDPFKRIIDKRLEEQKIRTNERDEDEYEDEAFDD